MVLINMVHHQLRSLGLEFKKTLALLTFIFILVLAFTNQLPVSRNLVLSYDKTDESIIFPPQSKVLKPAASHIYSIGDEEVFNVWEPADDTYKKVTATCKAISEQTYIFCDNKIDIAFDFVGLGEMVDTVMMPILVDNFAEPSDRDGNNRVVLLLTIIPGGFAGYFSSSDYYSYGEIVFLDLEHGISEATAIHELQHLIHFGFDPDEKIWFNEGCSKFSEILLSIAKGFNHSFSLYYPRGTSLLYWNYDIPGGNYQAAQIFISYLYDQYGSANLSAIYRASSGGVKLQSYSAIMSIVNQYFPSLTFERLYTNWIIANMVDSRYNGTTREYYYKSFNALPNYYSFPETGSFAKTYPYDETSQIYPWATKIYNFRDFPNPNNISISIDIPTGSQDHTFGITLIKETILNENYSDFSIQPMFLTKSNISEGIHMTLNKTAEGFDKLYLTVSHLDGGSGGYFWDIPSSEQNVQYHLKVISQDDQDISDTSDVSITSTNTTNWQFPYILLLAIGLIFSIQRRKI